MPFGLTNALVICQRQNNNILRPYLGKFVIYYFNNIFIYIKAGQDYNTYIKLIIKELAKVDLRFKLSKYKFGVKKATFLNYIIKLREIAINPVKIEAIQN